MKGTKRLVIIVLVAVAIVVVGWHLAANGIIGGAVQAMTGLPTRISGLHVGLLSTDVGIRGLKVSNPGGFPAEVMLDAPDIYVNYRLGSFFSGKPHLEHVRLHLEQFTVVKAADGRVNINSIKALKGGKEGTKPTSQPSPAAKAPQFQIDLLELKVGKVVYKDYTQTPTSVKEFNVNIDQRFENITNPYALAGVIVTSALMRTSIGQLADIDVAGLQAGVKGALKESSALLNKTGKEAVGEAEKFGREAVDSTKGAVQDAATGFKKLLGN